MSPSSHDGHHHRHEAPGASAAEIDPVCGMSVDPATAAGHVEHAGKTYHFCSTHCVQKFRADPEHYLTRPSAPPPALVQIGGIVPAGPAQTSGDYTCPMHPEVRASRAGICPICGMGLEPVSGAPVTRVEYVC